MAANIKYLKEVVLPWIEWQLNDPMSGSRTLWHATQVGEPSLDYEKISETISSLTSGCLTDQIVIPLINTCGM